VGGFGETTAGRIPFGSFPFFFFLLLSCVDALLPPSRRGHGPLRTGALRLRPGPLLPFFFSLFPPSSLFDGVLHGRDVRNRSNFKPCGSAELVRVPFLSPLSPCFPPFFFLPLEARKPPHERKTTQSCAPGKPLELSSFFPFFFCRHRRKLVPIRSSMSPLPPLPTFLVVIEAFYEVNNVAPLSLFLPPPFF